MLHDSRVFISLVRIHNFHGKYFIYSLALWNIRAYFSVWVIATVQLVQLLLFSKSNQSTMDALILIEFQFHSQLRLLFTRQIWIFGKWKLIIAYRARTLLFITRKVPIFLCHNKIWSVESTLNSHPYDVFDFFLSTLRMRNKSKMALAAKNNITEQ